MYLKKIGAAITESFTIAPGVILCAVLSIPLLGHKHDLSYLLPVILCYATMKIGVLFLTETADIVSPYKLLYICISLALVGSIVLLFTTDSQSSLYLIGSVIIGLGFSPFSSLYKQYLLPPDNTSIPHFKASPVISLIIGLSVAVGCIVSKHMNSRFMFYVWVGYVLIIWFFIHFACKDYISSEDSKIVTFRPDCLAKVPILIALFLLIASTYGYKKSVSHILFFVIFVIFIFCIIWCRRNYIKESKKHCLYSIWLGAVWGFIIFYCIVYLTDIYMHEYILLFYITIIISSFFPSVLQSFFTDLPIDKALKISSLTAIAGLVLLLSQNTALFFIGTFISSLFISYAKSVNLKSYYEDNPHNYKLLQDGHYYLGNGSIQSFTMIVFSAVCIMFHENRHEIMNEFINPTGLKENSFILVLSGIICIAVLLLLFIKIGKMDNTKTDKGDS